MSALHGQVPNLTNSVENHLSQMASWSEEDRKAYADVVVQLVNRLQESKVSLLGLSGAPGTGKSTLAAVLAESLQTSGTSTLVLSLDDFYLSRRRRQELAIEHAMLAQRGVPGTHDWNGLIEVLDNLGSRKAVDVRLPRFDKAKDDVAHDSPFIVVDGCPDLVILEGWPIGVPAQQNEELLEPINELEAQMDTDGQWRLWVNNQLARYYEDLATRLDETWFLSAPDWESVVAWRLQQEGDLAVSAGHSYLSDGDAVRRFLGQFQRIAVHMLLTCDDWADLVIRIDRRHRLAID